MRSAAITVPPHRFEVSPDRRIETIQGQPSGAVTTDPPMIRGARPIAADDAICGGATVAAAGLAVAAPAAGTTASRLTASASAGSSRHRPPSDVAKAMQRAYVGLRRARNPGPRDCARAH